jgi:hypothetical protein
MLAMSGGSPLTAEQHQLDGLLLQPMTVVLVEAVEATLTQA